MRRLHIIIYVAIVGLALSAWAAVSHRVEASDSALADMYSAVANKYSDAPMGTLPLALPADDDADTLVTDTLVEDSLNLDSIPLSLQEKMALLLEDDMFQTSIVGIEIYDLTADTMVYKYNERQTLRPASTMKLLSAITALDKLGGSYRFSTTLKSKGSIMERVDTLGKKHNVLVGDLVVRGGMDPMFNSDDMLAFVESLQKQKIDTIFGTITSDLTFKDTNRLGEGWCWDDKNPVLTPLLWDRKDNFTDKFRQKIRDAGIAICAATAAPRDSAFQADLKQQGVSERTLTTRYHSIDQVLQPMMKKSDNLYAECTFYQVAAASHKKYAAAKDAASTMHDLIRKLGLDPKRYYIADGSGLSLYNYQSPDMQVKMLRYAYRNSNIYSHLLPTLPIAGVDGTLSKRMTKSACRSHVKAKTGTVQGISALAGYVFTEKGNILCFSIMNSGIRHSSSGRNFQDRVCEVMYKYDNAPLPAVPANAAEVEIVE